MDVANNYYSFDSNQNSFANVLSKPLMETAKKARVDRSCPCVA
jgi:hypothetical protein